MDLAGFFQPEIAEVHGLSTHLTKIKNMTYYGIDLEPDMNTTYFLDEILTAIRSACLNLFNVKVKELEGKLG